MKPTRSFRRLVVQKIIMIIIVLSIFIVPTGVHINGVNDTRREINIMFEPNKESLIARNDVNKLDEIIDEEIEEEVVEVNVFEQILEQNSTLINFYCEMFNIDPNIILEDLKSKSINEEVIDINNLGFLKDKDNNLITHANIDLGLIAYFEEFISQNPQYNNKNIESYTGNPQYIEALIAYFTNVYTDVDYSIAISIGAAESGYYTAKNMLKVNNVFGGMSKRGLIKYSNIEIGVYKYIKLLNNNYFNKGLNTFELIGKYYCPTTINGIKQASPHWLSLVKITQSKYEEHNISKIEDVIILK